MSIGVLLDGAGGEMCSAGTQVEIGTGDIQVKVVGLGTRVSWGAISLVLGLILTLTRCLTHMQSISQSNQLGAQAFETLLQMHCLIG